MIEAELIGPQARHGEWAGTVRRSSAATAGALGAIQPAVIEQRGGAGDIEADVIDGSWILNSGPSDTN